MIIKLFHLYIQFPHNVRLSHQRIVTFWLLRLINSLTYLHTLLMSFYGRLWCTSVVFMHAGVKVKLCRLNSCCQTRVKLMATLTLFPAHGHHTHVCARALSCCDFTSDMTWSPNRPDLNSVDYRLLRVMQECVYQKQQGTSNIVDVLWLLTEWYITFHKARNTHQKRWTILTQCCCKFIYYKNKRMHFLPHSVSRKTRKMGPGGIDRIILSSFVLTWRTDRHRTDIETDFV